jgi:hypothetical protein
MVSRSKGVKWIGLGIARVRGRIAASSRDEQMLALGSEAASQIASYVQCKSVFTLATFLMSWPCEEQPQDPLNN